MGVRWILAAVHLAALGIGLGAVWARGRALGSSPTPETIRRALYADAWWGVAALLWVTTGVVRAFGGLEKGSSYYLQNHLFLAKMGLFLLILLLEIAPMITLIRWRQQLRGGASIDTSSAGRLARMSYVQAGLVLLAVLAATGMARGFGSGAH